MDLCAETKLHDLLFSSLESRLVYKHSDEDARIKPDSEMRITLPCLPHLCIQIVDLKSSTWTSKALHGLVLSITEEC
jgi:hypothetical protein